MMHMPHVVTKKEAIHVPVMMVGKAMASPVMVILSKLPTIRLISKYIIMFISPQYILYLYFLPLDVDECENERPCDINAECTNEDGGFSCQCSEGFMGDGLNCDGKYCVHIL